MIFPQLLKSHITNDCVVLLMGARDPSLDTFAQYVWEKSLTVKHSSVF